MAHEIPAVLGYHGQEIRFYDELLGGKGSGDSPVNPNLTTSWRPLHSAAAGPGGSRLSPGCSDRHHDAGRPGHLYERDTMPPYVRVVAGAAKLPDDQSPRTVIDPRFPVSDVVLYPDTASVSPAPIRAGQTSAHARDQGDARHLGSRAHMRGEPARAAPTPPPICSCRENWYPDWHAERRRQTGPAASCRSHAAERGRCPPGAREVRFVFASATYAAGAGSHLPSLLLAAALCARHHSAAEDRACLSARSSSSRPITRGPTSPLIVPQILQQDIRLEVLVVDDNSPDGTGELADEMAAAEPRVHVLHRPGKEGLGKAYLAGFRWALERGYDYIFEMDADFSHDPKYLPEFLQAIERADLVVGSRYHSGVNVINWPISPAPPVAAAPTCTPGGSPGFR